MRRAVEPVPGKPRRDYAPAFHAQEILLRAYNVKEYQIVGPGSLDTDVYDVNAMAAPGTTQEQFQIMLRYLLAERLKFAHLESPDSVSGYELTARRADRS
jgi:uncharacterized protein (TIGR03435 family)